MARETSKRPSPRKQRKFFLIISTVLSLLGLGLWLSSYVIEFTKTQAFDRITSNNGFGVTAIELEGRVNTPLSIIRNAIDVHKGQSMFSLHLDTIKNTLQQIGWIQSVNVQRRFPTTLFISIKERVPVAIWQVKKTLRLIDKTGRAISFQDVGKFSFLKVLVGIGANVRALEFLHLIASAPKLSRLTTAGILIANRRWNAVLLGKITVKLPEYDPKKAWETVASYVERENLLARPLRSIDMRIPGKILLDVKNAENRK